MDSSAFVGQWQQHEGPEYHGAIMGTGPSLWPPTVPSHLRSRRPILLLCFTTIRPQVIEAKGGKALLPSDRSGLHPLLIPLASDASGSERVTCLLRWPKPSQHKVLLTNAKLLIFSGVAAAAVDHGRRVHFACAGMLGTLTPIGKSAECNLPEAMAPWELREGCEGGCMPNTTYWPPPCASPGDDPACGVYVEGRQVRHAAGAQCG